MRRDRENVTEKLRQKKKDSESKRSKTEEEDKRNSDRIQLFLYTLSRISKMTNTRKID